MSGANTISSGNQPGIITNANVPGILRHIPSPKENVVLKAISGFFKWAFADTAAIVVVRSLRKKKLEFIQRKDLVWVIGGGIALGLLDGIAAIYNNTKNDDFARQLELIKLQAQSKSVKVTKYYEQEQQTEAGVHNPKYIKRYEQERTAQAPPPSGQSR